MYKSGHIPFLDTSALLALKQHKLKQQPEKKQGLDTTFQLTKNIEKNKESKDRLNT